MKIDNLTESQIRTVVREEWARLEQEKQDACDHARSGTIRDSLLFCDDCGKQLSFEDQHRTDKPGAELAPIEQRHVDRVRGQR